MTLETIDIEGALYEALAEAGWDASAPPVPHDLGRRLPHVHVTRTGGWQATMVSDVHAVDLDAYASDEASAMAAAGALTGFVRQLAGRSLGGVPCYTAEVTTLPYGNPDPAHQDVARATLKAQISTRMA